MTDSIDSFKLIGYVPAIVSFFPYEEPIIDQLVHGKENFIDWNERREKEIRFAWKQLLFIAQSMASMKQFNIILFEKL